MAKPWQNCGKDKTHEAHSAAEQERLENQPLR